MSGILSRALKLRIPFFMHSETLEVNYVRPWARSPLDVYGQLGFSRFDGIDAVINLAAGDVDITIQPFYGETSPEQDFQGETGELDVTELWGLSVTAQIDWLKVRLAHTEGDWSINGVTTLDGFLLGLTGAGYTNIPATSFDETTSGISWIKHQISWR